MSREHITDVLAERLMGWKVCPDRFIKAGRSWIPKWRFSPLTRLEHAFELLAHLDGTYTLSSSGGLFRAEVHVGGRTGEASGAVIAATITLAVAKALGLEV